MKTRIKLTVFLFRTLTVFQARQSVAQDQDGFSNPVEGLHPAECLADGFECFQLFNRCEPIAVSVGVTDNQIGITEERVRTAVESRLRAARLYDPNSGPYLLVAVDITEEAYSAPFHFSLNFRKWLFDELTGDTRLAGNWDSGTYGVASEAGFILQGISELMDGFINDYLRVNQVACD